MTEHDVSNLIVGRSIMFHGTKLKIISIGKRETYMGIKYRSYLGNWYYTATCADEKKYYFLHSDCLHTETACCSLKCAMILSPLDELEEMLK